LDNAVHEASITKIYQSAQTYKINIHHQPTANNEKKKKRHPAKTLQQPFSRQCLVSTVMPQGSKLKLTTIVSHTENITDTVQHHSSAMRWTNAQDTSPTSIAEPTAED
jgi:hypothetical protein